MSPLTTRWFEIDQCVICSRLRCFILDALYLACFLASEVIILVACMATSAVLLVLLAAYVEQSATVCHLQPKCLVESDPHR